MRHTLSPPDSLLRRVARRRGGVRPCVATLKCELLYRHHWPTRAAARAAIFDFIEAWYNRRRRHSTLGYVSPTEYERTYALALATA